MLPVVLAVAALTAAPDPATSALVKQLSAKSFRVREAAAAKLVAGGSASVPALSAGSSDEDPQIRDRCRQLLPEAAGLERRMNLERLVADPKSPPSKRLPSLARFLAAVGDTKQTREMYVAMMSTHHETFELIETNPKKAAQRFGEFVYETAMRAQNGGNFNRGNYDNAFATPADITFFLFAAADPRMRLRDADPNFLNHGYILFYGSQLRKAVTEKDSTVARKLFLDWLESESDDNLLQGAMQMATDSGIKEVLPIVLKSLTKKDNVQPYSRAQAMIAVARLGGKEHVKNLEPFLDDKTDLGTINFGNAKMLTAQLRDVALGVSIHLMGQKRADFGFDTQFGGTGVPSSYHYLGFPDAGTRDEAFKKWKEYLAKTPEEKAKKDDPKAKKDEPKSLKK